MKKKKIVRISDWKLETRDTFPKERNAARGAGQTRAHPRVLFQKRTAPSFVPLPNSQISLISREREREKKRLCVGVGNARRAVRSLDDSRDGKKKRRASHGCCCFSSLSLSQISQMVSLSTDRASGFPVFSLWVCFSGRSLRLGSSLEEFPASDSDVSSACPAVFPEHTLDRTPLEWPRTLLIQPVLLRKTQLLSSHSRRKGHHQDSTTGWSHKKHSQKCNAETKAMGQMLGTVDTGAADDANARYHGRRNFAYTSPASKDIHAEELRGREPPMELKLYFARGLAVDFFPEHTTRSFFFSLSRMCSRRRARGNSRPR